MKDAVAVFNEWAEIDKDLGMEKGHADAVTEMLDFALKERHRINNNFTFLDLGCGNGWVVRKVIENPLCINASGIDGAPQMIENAIKRGDGEEFLDTRCAFNHIHFVTSRQAIEFFELSPQQE